MFVEKHISEVSERASFSIREFCQRHGISSSTFYKEQREGRGPSVFYLGYSPRIALQAEREWLRAQQDNVQEIELRRADLRNRAKRAGDASVESPNHVSRRSVRTGAQKTSQ